MKRVTALIIMVIAFAGCTSVNVKKVDSNEHKISLVCIEENPMVLVSDFLTVVENGFIRHGIETEIYTGNPPPHCQYILTYNAKSGWDLAPFLNYAELRLKHGNKTITTATYKHSGGFALNKWASTESKMTPVIDQLLSDFHKELGKDTNNNSALTINRSENNHAYNTMQNAQTSLKELEAQTPSESVCKIEFSSTSNLEITLISSYARNAGLNVGDHLVSIDGENLASSKDVLLKIMDRKRVNDLLKITVERNGVPVELEVMCRDGRKQHLQYIEIIRATSLGQWDKCIQKTYEMEKEWGKYASYAGARLGCNEAKRSQYNLPKDYTVAELVYEYLRRKINEASNSTEDLESIRSSVLKNISMLESDHFYLFANDLKSQWESAINRDRILSKTAEKISVSFGTGFIVSPDGLILTAYHIIDEAKSIKIILNDVNSFEANVVSSSKSTDLAVLRINTSTPYYLTLAPTREIKVGEQIFTMGYPLKDILGKEPKFTDGSISALSGLAGEATFFQMSVPVQPGNSGGPVVNDKGQVVGIVTATAAIRPFLAYSGTIPQNINWAVKSDYALPLFNAPKPLPDTSTRDSAIEQVKKAICAIEVNSLK